MKITMFLAAIYLTSFTINAWAGEEYCGQLAYIREGSASQKGYYLKTEEFSAHLLNIKPNSETDQYLSQLLKKQQQDIGVCITGILGAEEANPIQNGIRVITEVTAAKNYNNGNLPDSLSMLKLSIVYEGVWDVLPRVGELNVYAHPTSGKITNITLSIWEPTQNSSEDRTLETISIEELLSGKTIRMPEDTDEPMVKIAAGTGFTAYGGEVKITFKTKNGFESQLVKLKRDNATGKYSLWKDTLRVTKITVVAKGLTKSSGYADSYQLK